MGLSINHYICPEGFGLAGFLDLAADCGARAVGLTVRALREAGVAELRTMLGDRGLAVSSLNSAGRFTVRDPERRRAQDRLNAELIEAAAELRAGVLCVITGGSAAGGESLAAARGRVADGLAALAEAAAAAGVRLGLEPVHPAEILIKGCVNSVAGALAATDGLPAAGLLLDFYHSWWDPDLWTVLERQTDRVALMQFCNVAEPDPEKKAVRDVPSTGVLDVAGMLRRARAAGYAGDFEFELFARHLRGRGVEDVVRRAAREFAAMG